jgi:hypothetical protein
MRRDGAAENSLAMEDIAFPPRVLTLSALFFREGIRFGLDQIDVEAPAGVRRGR